MGNRKDNAFSDHAKGAITVVYRALRSLKLDPRNPRLHSAKQIRQIAESIRVFGFNVPVLVDAGLKVIAGHGRILACQQLGWSEVPVIQLEHLSQAQARAFAIADNKLTENSVWDDRLLAEQLKELSLSDLDFSLEATGFEMGEIDLRIENLSGDAVVDDDPADTAPSDDTGPPISRPGDLWQLGVHRVVAVMLSTRRHSELCLARTRLRWRSLIHRTMCRSKETSAV
jgi:ParB-like chromosome segregation protein Spo0J